MPTFKELYPQYYTDEYQTSGPERPPDPNPDVSPLSQYADSASIGRPSPRQMTMAQFAGQGELPRYTDVRPPASSLAQKLIGFTGGNYARDYALQQQRFDAAQEHREQRKAQQAAVDAQTEMLLFDKIQKADPGERQPYVKALSSWYEAKGVKPYKGYLDVWNKAEADELDIYKQAGTEYLKQQAIENNWDEAQLQEKMKSMLASPVAFARIHSEAMKLKKLQEETKNLRAQTEEIAGFTQAMKETNAPGSPTSPQSSPPSANPRPAPMTQPGPSQGPSMGTPMLRPTGTEGEANIPTRNNNPTNIKVGPATVKWIKAGVAEPGDTAQDGGRFLKFKTPEAGFQAADDLLKQPFYADKNLEEAMRAWSGGGYGAEVAKGLSPAMKVGQLPPEARQHLIQSMAVREGFGARPSTQAAASGANEQELKALQDYKARIDDLQMRIEKLSPFATRQGPKRYLEELRATQKTLMENRDRIEKRYETAPKTPEEKAAVRIFGKPYPTLDTNEQQIVAEEAPKLEAKDEALKARESAEATEESKMKVSGAQGLEAVMRQPVSDTDRKNLRVYDKEKDDWVKIPVNWNQRKLQEAPGEIRHLVPLEETPAKDYRNLVAAKAAASNILPELEKPEVQKEIGNIFSNPEAWLKRVKAQAGKDLPASVYKVRSELSRLQATLQRYYSGTAQTKTELKTLDPFIVHLTDPTPLNATTKLKALLGGIEKEYQARRDFDLDNGSYVPKIRDMKPAEVEPEAPPEKSKVQQLLDIWKK